MFSSNAKGAINLIKRTLRVKIAKIRAFALTWYENRQGVKKMMPSCSPKKKTVNDHTRNKDLEQQNICFQL